MKKEVLKALDEKFMSQKDLVLKYLNEHPEGITSLKAIRELGIIQLPRRIFDLRMDGLNVVREWVIGRNARGELVRYGVYRLEEL